ncbi:MAG: hypothetical protein AAFX53_16130 [Bacteroidota bacterium]
MKKNQKTYVLLAIVLGVWGLIGFKLLKAANPEPVETAPLMTKERFVPETIQKRDTFTILANYRDPFLGTVSTPKIPKRKTTAQPQKKKAPEKQISYTGFVANGSSDPDIFFVTIEGQEQMMTVNAVASEVKLIHGTKQMIKVRYDGMSKTIALSQ